MCTPKLSLEQLLDILRVAVRLITLSISKSFYIDPEGDTPVPVTNNAMKTLNAWDLNFLPYLTLPSLTTVRIDKYCDLEGLARKI